MDIIDNIIHPKSFLGIADLRVGTFVLALVNFVLILVKFGFPNFSFEWIISIVLTILALVCTGFGWWGAYNRNAQHVSWYYYYCIVNLVLAIVNCVLCLLSINIGEFIRSFIHLVIAIYTLCIVKSFLEELNGGETGATAATTAAAGTV